MLSGLDALVAGEKNEFVRAVVVGCRDGGFVGHDDTGVVAGGVEELRAGDFRGLVVQLRGGEAVCWDGLGGEAQRGALACWVGAARSVEVGWVADAEGFGVFVAADGVGRGRRPGVEVLDLGAEGFACAACEGICVWGAGGVEGEDDAS